MPYLLTDTTLNGAFSNYQQPRFLSCARPLEERVSFMATAYRQICSDPQTSFRGGVTASSSTTAGHNIRASST